MGTFAIPEIEAATGKLKEGGAASVVNFLTQRGVLTARFWWTIAQRDAELRPDRLARP